jgi:putative ATP-dependent endonuclease of OLD family
MASNIAAISNPLIRRLTIQKYRGVQAFEWRPSEGLNIILGGGDVGKTTILEAISLLLSPTGSTTLSGADFLDCNIEQGFEIEAVMSVPETCGINQQSKQAWPWRWDGENPQVADLEKGDGESTDIDTPVYRLRVSANADFELSYEILQPDGSTNHFPVAVRRAIGLVRLGGDDRNDRDLRLVQGSALDRLLSDATLRPRLGQVLADQKVKDQLKDDAKTKLKTLDAAFQKRALPHDLGLGVTPGQGFSIGSLIGLTASKDDIQLPLSNWGSGTRRLSSLEVAAAHHTGQAITVVDEVERGLEPYRLRALVSRLQSGNAQVFLTTHNGVAISSANKAALWYVDSKGAIGSLPQEKISRQQARDPETFLARLTVVTEGECEKGFLRRLFARTNDTSLHDRGIWITEGGGNDSALSLLEALATGGLQFGGFVDNEGRDPGRWGKLKTQLGPLLFQWATGCLEENIIREIPTDRLEEFITDPDGHAGEKASDARRPFRDCRQNLRSDQAGRAEPYHPHYRCGDGACARR